MCRVHPRPPILSSTLSALSYVQLHGLLHGHRAQVLSPLQPQTQVLSFPYDFAPPPLNFVHLLSKPSKLSTLSHIVLHFLSLYTLNPLNFPPPPPLAFLVQPTPHLGSLIQHAPFLGSSSLFISLASNHSMNLGSIPTLQC